MEAMSALLRFGTRRTLFVAVGVVTLGGGAAFAGTTPPDTGISLDWNNGSATTTYTIHDADNWGVNGGLLWMNGTDRDGTAPDGSDDTWRLDWEMQTVAPGARGGTEFVQANIAVFNNTLATQTYWILQTKPINITSMVSTNGSVSATVLDVTGDSATMQNITSGPFNGDPIYRSYINGVAQTPLWPAGFSLTASGIGASDTDSDNFSGINGPAPTASIGVWLKFEVTPLDQVTMSGYFEVTPVPAPAALPLLGMMGLVARRRRRS